MLELLPNAVRFAVLVNPSSRNAEALTRDAQAAASIIGRQVEILAASTPREIDAAFASAMQKRSDALVVSPEPLLDNRRVHLVTLAAHQRLPAIYAFRENVEIGGLMSYGSNAGERDVTSTAYGAIFFLRGRRDDCTEKSAITTKTYCLRVCRSCPSFVQ
jgi:ABC-type uncharacterized transport system substrate-binding protein